MSSAGTSCALCAIASAALFLWHTRQRCSDDCTRAALTDLMNRRCEANWRHSRRSVRVLLIRHAQSESNRTKNDRHNGRHLDVHLSVLGQLQARALGQRLARMWFKESATEVKLPQRFVASEAVRAQETGEIALAAIRLHLDQQPAKYVADLEAANKQIPALEVVSTRHSTPKMGICEVSMGSWTGKPKSECHTGVALRKREIDAWEWRSVSV